MTTAAVPITFKCPPDLIDHLPAPGRGRSRAIVQTLREKYARAQPVQWKPTNERGRKLAALLAAGRHERGKPMTVEEVDRELRERRGGVQ